MEEGHDGIFRILIGSAMLGVSLIAVIIFIVGLFGESGPMWLLCALFICPIIGIFAILGLIILGHGIFANYDYKLYLKETRGNSCKKPVSTTGEDSITNDSEEMKIYGDKE